MENNIIGWCFSGVPELPSSGDCGDCSKGRDMRVRVEVNDMMQQGYVYDLTEPIGQHFHPDFPQNPKTPKPQNP